MKTVELKDFTGWIDAKGGLVPCPYSQHLETARALGETNPDLAGWIHVVYAEFLPGLEDFVPTPRQVDAILAICKASNAALPTWA